MHNADEVYILKSSLQFKPVFHQVNIPQFVTNDSKIKTHSGYEGDGCMIFH